MAFRLFDRVAETTTTTGTGTLTLAGAKTGYRAFSAVYANNDLMFYTIAHQSADEWEVGVGTWQTGGSLVRTSVLSSSNAGSAVSFSAGTKDVFVTGPAKMVTPRRLRFCGRLTTETGVAVSTSDRTSQGTLYYTPFRECDPGNEISLYNTTMGEWETITFAETSLSVSITSGQVKDVFGYNNSGTLALEFSSAWTNDTTRAEALTTQDGVRVKNSDKSRLWLGTVCGTGTNIVEDSAAIRYVVNGLNRVPRAIYKHDSTQFWSYIGATFGYWNAASGNNVKAIILPDYNLSLRFDATGAISGTSNTPFIGISQDYPGTGTPTTICDAYNFLWSNGGTVGGALFATYDGAPTEGRHTYHMLQNSGSASLTAYFYGAYNTSGVGVINKSALKGTLWG